MYPLSRRALAEFIGTLALIFVGAGSILSDRLTGGGVSLVGIALAHGLTIAVMVSAFGHISGGHLNPAVTLGAVFARKISPGDALVYGLSQLAGGVTGAFLLTLVFDPATRQAANLGTPGLAAGVTASAGLACSRSWRRSSSRSWCVRPPSTDGAPSRSSRDFRSGSWSRSTSSRAVR
jgi:aquaporin Z